MCHLFHLIMYIACIFYPACNFTRMCVYGKCIKKIGGTRGTGGTKPNNYYLSNACLVPPLKK